jgi:ferredoxin
MAKLYSTPQSATGSRTTTNAAPRHAATCRIQILDGISHVSARSLFEEQITFTRGWEKFTRLACQTKVHGNVEMRRRLDHRLQYDV